jgi:hypothetical protein
MRALTAAGAAYTALLLAPVAHGDVNGQTGDVDLTAEAPVKCVVVPDYVRCRAPHFANAPAEAIAPPAQGGDTMITVTPGGAVSWGYGTATGDVRANGAAGPYELPGETIYHFAGWTIKQGNGAVAVFTNDATGHGLRVEGGDILPPIQAFGF